MVVVNISSESQWRSEHSKNRDKLVVVDFFATWCGPCKTIAPFFDDLSNRYSKEAAFYRVDVDAVQDIAQANGVEAMPTFLFFVNGSKIETLKGADQRRLEQLVKDLSAKHTKNVFKSGGGYSLGGANAGSSASGAKPAGGGAPGGAGGARKNPWSDPNFVAKKLNMNTDKPSTPSSTPATSTPSTSAAASTRPPAAATPSTPAPAPAPASAASTSSNSAASSHRSEPKGLAALSASAIKEKTTAAPPSSASSASSSASTPSKASATNAPLPASTGGGAAVDSKLLEEMIGMGIEASHAEHALRTTAKVGLEGEHHLNAAMDWAFSHPPPSTPSTATPTSSANKPTNTPSTAPTNIAATASSSSPAPASSSTASSTSSKADATMDDMDEEEAVIFAAMKDKISKEKASATSGPTDSSSLPARAEEREQKKLSEMTSEEKMQWLARRKLEVKAKREKEAIEREKDSEKSRRAIHHAQTELKEKMERDAAENLAKQKRKEEIERRKVRNDLRDKLKADKERRIKEQAAEIERVKKMKEAQAAGKK